MYPGQFAFFIRFRSNFLKNLNYRSGQVNLKSSGSSGRQQSQIDHQKLYSQTFITISALNFFPIIIKLCTQTKHAIFLNCITSVVDSLASKCYEWAKTQHCKILPVDKPSTRIRAERRSRFKTPNVGHQVAFQHFSFNLSFV